MRRLPRPICAGSIAGFLAALSVFQTRSQAATYYWDINGATAGSGVAGAGNTDWAGTNWNLNGAGTGATSLWQAGSIATFSAGTDATGLTYNVNVGTGLTFDIGGLVFEEGSTIIGGAGALNLSTPAAEFFVAGGLSSQLNATLTGSGSIRKTGTGSLRLGGNNTFTGALTISAGVISITDPSALGLGSAPVTIEGNTTRGQGGGSLVLGGTVGTGFTVNKTIFAQGGGVGGDAAAVISMGTNTINSLVTGTSAATRLFSMGGMTTVNGLIAGPGQNTQFNGPGHWTVNGAVISGQGGSLLQKAGSGGMILLAGNTLAESGGEVRVSGGTLRVSSGQGVPILSMDSGVLELRTDTPDSFADTKFNGFGSSNLFADHAAGSTAGLINQQIAFTNTTFGSAGVTYTYLSRNGYGLTLGGLGPGGPIAFTADGTAVLTNSMSAKLILDGELKNGTLSNGVVTANTITNSRTYTVNGNGDTDLTGAITLTGASHIFAKGGNGTMTLKGSGSTYAGTNISAGTLAVTQLTAVGNGALNIGTAAGTVAGTLTYLGAAGTGAGETSTKVLNLAGTTANGIVLANQTGSALVLASNIAATGTGAKSLVLGGTSTADNKITGVIQDNDSTNKTSLVKIGAGTWTYSPSTENYASSVNATTGAQRAVNSTAATGQADITLTDITNVFVGQLVTGTNVPSGATVKTINGNTITLSTNITTAISANTTLTFGTPTNANTFQVNGGTSGIVLGQVVTGTGIPASSVVTGINPGAGTVTISSSATSTTSIGGGNTITFGAVSSFTGNVTVSGGTLKMKPSVASGTGSDLLPTSSSLTFAADTVTSNGFAGGTFEYVGADTGVSLEQMGAVSTTGTGITSAGASTLKVTPTGGQSATLRVNSISASTAGASLNLVVPANGAIQLLPGGSGFSSGRMYFNGADFAFLPSGANAVVRAPVYGPGGIGGDAGFATSATALFGGFHNQITGSFATNSLTTSSLKISGSNTLTLNASQVLTVGNTSGSGVIQTGGISTITGGAGLATSVNTNDLVVRVDGVNDALTIATPITTTTGGVTKNGAGTLTLSGAGSWSGFLIINEGTLKLGASTLSSSPNISAVIRTDGTLDLNSFTLPTNAINALAGSGTITNSAGSGSANLRFGEFGGSSLFSGVIKNGANATVSLTKSGGGFGALTGLNTFTGPMTILAGTVQVTTLADIGQPSGIGAGLVGSNAASLVFSGGTLQYVGATNSGNNIFQSTATPSVSINRQFTLAGNGTIDSSGSFGNNVIGARVGNNAALIFNSTADVTFSGSGARSLTLKGDSQSDNEIRLRLADNPNGGALSVVKQDTGVWILGGTNNTYTGNTRIDLGILRAVDGSSLSPNSNLQLAGGTFESRNNSFTRSLGTSAGTVQWTANGGFSAAETRLTVNIGGSPTPATLTWGVNNFVGDNNSLLLGSAVSLAEIEFMNPLNLGGNSGARTIQVDDNGNTALDYAILSGVISSNNASPVFTKAGTGTLYLTNDGNSYQGNTSINAGTIIVDNIGSSAAATSQLGKGTSAVLLSGGTLSYVGNGETTNRSIQMNGSGGIDASGSGPLVLTNFTNVNATTSARTLTLSGFSSEANEIQGVLSDGGSPVLNVSKSGPGVWLFNTANNYTGTTTINGAVGIGTNQAFGTTGTVSLNNATVFAVNGDHSIPNPTITFVGNTTNAVSGDNNLVFGTGATTVNFGSSSGDNTLTNFLSTGKTLTINGTMINLDTSTNRRLTVNGTGTTIISAAIVDQPTNSRTSAITYSGTGLLVLTGTNSTYSGSTIAAGGAGGALQAIGGQTLSPNTALQLNGGVFQSSGTIGQTILPLGTGAGQVAWTGSGGFAAAGGDLTLNFNSGNELVWGSTPAFLSSGSNFVFGSFTADSAVLWKNPIDMNPVLNTNVTRTFTVNDNPNLSTDQVILQGVLRQSQTLSGGTGQVSITKAGLGVLIIESDAMRNSNAFGGTISVTGGTLQLGTTSSASPLAGIGGSYNMSPSAGGTSLVLNHVTMLRAGSFTANAGSATGGILVTGTSDSAIQLTTSATIGAVRDYIINDNPLVVDDVIFTVPLVNGPGGAAAQGLSKQGAGQLVFQGDNTYQGPTVVYKGSLVYDYTVSTGSKLSDIGDLEMRGGTVVFKGSNSGPVVEAVGNLSPGSSNLGQQLTVRNDNPNNSSPNTLGSFLNNTTPSLGAQSSIILQPTATQNLTLNFAGFIRNPGGGIVLLSTTDAARGKFTTDQVGDLGNGKLLAVNALLGGRWLAQSGTGEIQPFYGVAESDPGKWDPLKTPELIGSLTGSQTLGPNQVPGLIISGGDTELTLNNPSRSLLLSNGALLVPTGTPASLIKVTGGKLMTSLPYKTAQGADLLIENFGTGVLSISSNLGYSDAPQGNAQIITVAGTGVVELSGQNSSILTYLGTARQTGSVKIIGGATLRIGGDGVTSDAISDYLPVDFGSTGDVAGTLQLNGKTETIGGIVSPANTNIGTNNAIIDLGSGGALTVNQFSALAYNGTITGSGSFTKQGNAAFTVTSLTGNNPLTFSGNVTVGGGLLALTGNQSDGLTGAVNQILLRGGEIQAEHNSGGLIVLNKLPDSATVKLEGTINQGLRITSNTSGRTESIKAVWVSEGANTITVDSANTTSQLALKLTDPTSPLLRSNFATLLVKGDNLGGGLGGGLNTTALITLGNGAAGVNLVGGTGSTVSTYGIVPWMLGSIADPTVAVVGDSFVTYGANGLRPLNTSSEYLFNNYATAANLTNLSISTASNTALAGKTINSLRFDGSGGDTNLNVSSGTLTVSSGAILATMGGTTNTALIGNTVTPAFSSFLAPGSTNELIFSVTSTNANAANAKLIVQPAIIGALVSVTKTGPGTLQLLNSNNFGGGLTINQGVLEFTANQATNSLGDTGGEIRLAGGTLRFSNTNSSSSDLTTHPIKLYGPSSFYTASGNGATGNALARGSVIEVVNQTLTMRGASGDGGFVKTGDGILTLTTPSTFTGSMAVLRGTVNINAGLTGASGLFIAPENVATDTVQNSPPIVTVNFNSASPLSVNQLIVGGVFTSASTLAGKGLLFVGSTLNHPAVTIGNGSGDSFMLVGYHDEGAANGAAATSITTGQADFSKASSVNINVSRLLVGQNKGSGSGRTEGDIFFPDSPTANNSITAGFIVIGSSPGPDSAASGGLNSSIQLGFGRTDIKADSITIGGQNTNGKMVLNGDINGRGRLYITDRSGLGGANLFIGDNDDITAANQDSSTTTLDTISGEIYADLNMLVIGRHGGFTSHTSTAGKGAGSLRFQDGYVNAASVILATTGTRVTTNDPLTSLDPHPEYTQAEITQQGGTFRFGTMIQGAGGATYNWNTGTIEPYNGGNAVNTNVVFTARADSGPDVHIVSVPGLQQRMTFDTAASFKGSGSITKTGLGTLELRGDSTGSQGLWEIQAGRVYANNGAGRATGGSETDVYPGAELGGSGSLGGLILLKGPDVPSGVGGKLTVGAAPGQIGTLTLDEGASLYAEADSVLQLEIKTNALVPTGDHLFISGLLNIDAEPGGFGTNVDLLDSTTTTLSITDIDPKRITSGSITLITTNGGWTGAFFKTPDGTVIYDYNSGDPNAGTIFYVGTNAFQLDYNGGINGSDVVLIAVPEPGALASLIGGVGMLLGLQRFRRRG